MLMRLLCICCLAWLGSSCWGVNVSQLTSSLQVVCGTPVLHSELGRVRGALKSGKHMSAHFPIAGGKREQRVLPNIGQRKVSMHTDFTAQAGGSTNLLCKHRGAFPIKRTHLRMMTLPTAVAVIWPSSEILNFATTLSSKNKPSGSFFATAYQVPAYCEKEIQF